MTEKQIRELGLKYRRSKNYYEFCKQHGKTGQAAKAKRDMESAMRELQQIRAGAVQGGAYRTSVVLPGTNRKLA